MELTDQQTKMWLAMLRTTTHIKDQLAIDMQTNYDLHITWFEVLVNLYAAPDYTLRMNRLADKVLMSNSGLTRLLDRMVEAGFIKRQLSPEDRRVVYAVLTDVGLKRIAEIFPQHQQRIYEYLVQHLTEEEISTIKNAFERVLSQSVVGSKNNFGK